MRIDPKPASTKSLPPIGNDELVVGDVVQLRSGSPVMTVTSYYFSEPDGIGYTHCEWYIEATRDWGHKKFDRRVLVRVK